MTSLKTFLDELQIKPAQTHRGMAAFPLVSTKPATRGYMTLQEAMTRRCARVTEVSLGGSVPELRFENLSGKRILLLDGEELVGARQNRVLNTTVLVGAWQSVTIPVSCVERGRWAYVTREFRCSERKLFASARASKMEQVSRSLRDEGSRRADQLRLWADVSEAAACFDVRSATEAMRDVYEKQGAELAQYEYAFTALPSQVGAVFSLNGRIVGLDVFDTDEAFSLLLRKLVSGYAFDALRSGGSHVPAPTLDSVKSFLDALAAAPGSLYEAVGEGQELRVESPGLSAAALILADRPIHVAAFATEA